jgi:hypothetical protein
MTALDHTCTRWLPTTGRPTSRARRVAVVLGVVIVLSAVDLVATVHAMHTTGMSEGNPIAAWVARTTGSAAALVLLKLVTVGLGVGVLFGLRARVQAEVASWFVALILVGLTARWVAWHHTMREFATADLRRIRHIDPDWIAFGMAVEESASSAAGPGIPGSGLVVSATPGLTPPGAGLVATLVDRSIDVD